MYEAFYGLSRRPFAATPDPGCWFRCARYQAAIDELLVCAEQGQGIGILVAPAGTGKTLLCERLIRDIGEPFTSVLLRHATYNTRRGFLQTLLCELTQPYDKHTDQELRLGLAPVLKGLHQHGRALLLVVDEAHQLSESLLEELRILADQAEDGQPIVRLILTGQFGLEEKLAHPALQALNQRVRAQVTLEPLTLAESADYVDFRITWGGGRTASIFTEEAIAAISRAADGVPRCLNQLCDHALLLGYANEQRPVTAETIATALDDLRHLPLPWNLSGTIASESATVAEAVIESEPVSSTVTEWESGDMSSLEIGSDLEDVDELLDEYPDDTAVEESEELTPPPVATPPVWETALESADLDSLHEEPVYDRYNALDAGLEPIVVPVASPPMSSTFAGLPFSVTTSLFGAGVSPTERLETIQSVLEAVEAGEFSAEAVEDVIETPEPAMVSSSAVFEFGSDEPPAAIATEPVAPRKASCRNLFTRLRRKQMGR